MGRQNLLAVLILWTAMTVPLAAADEVRYFEKDGVTYRETRRVVRRPVVETRLESREQTVYREQLRTEVQETQRTYHTPVTEYQWATRMRGRWNPFIQPYYTQELVPTMRWEARQDVVRVPVSRRELVPEKRTVQVPVTTQRVAEEEVITRVAVSSTPAGALGGVARLENDPPRHGASVPAVDNAQRR